MRFLIILLAVSASAHEGHERSAALGVQSLDFAVAGGGVHALTVEYGADGKAKVFYRAPSGEKTRVDAKSPPIAYANRGNDVPLAVSGKDLLALWPKKGTGYMDSGPIVAAASRDGGKTWAPAATPADDGTTTGHRFLAAATDDKGAIHAVWLDNRTGKQALYHASTSDAGKTWSKDALIDPWTCECCWNKIAAAPGGRLYVLYRAMHPRDMALAVSSDYGKTWKTSKGVGRFNWDVNICPHAGGGLAVAPVGGRPRVHVLAYNGAEDAEGLYYLWSDNDGATWSRRKRLGPPGSRHGDIASSPDGKSLVATWDSQSGKVYAAKSDDSGSSWSEPRLLADARGTHPRVVALGGGFEVFWTEQKPDKPAELKSAAL